MGFLSAEQELLDEAQGLTNEMIIDNIQRRGWTLSEDKQYWRKPGASFMRSISAWQAGALACIATSEGMQLQELMRDINPRMRRGWPSDAALAAHKIWVVRSRASLAICKYWPCDRDLMINGEHVSCWPCDENGNKVRWPTNAAGEML